MHTADALRLLLLYKFGGFYLDLDYVVFNDLSHYHNIVVGNKPWDYTRKIFTFLIYFNFRETTNRGLISVTNNAFSFTKHHPLPLMAMNHLKQSYNPSCWSCIGPKLITSCVRRLARTKYVQNIAESSQIHFTPLKRIMTVHFLKVRQTLFPDKPKTFHQWEKLFAQSSAVHFFSKETSGLPVSDSPQYSAYALLAPRYCPLAWHSQRYFW